MSVEPSTSHRQGLSRWTIIRFLLLLAIVVLVFACWTMPRLSSNQPGQPALSFVPQPADTPLLDEKGRVRMEAFLGLSAHPVMQPKGMLETIEKHAVGEDAAMIVEALRFIRDPDLYKRMDATLARILDQRPGKSYRQWFRVLWDADATGHPKYAEYKSKMYLRIDERFQEYFYYGSQTPAPKIRLDEIAWGGVKRDGIPPLEDPKTLAVSQATYLDDNDVVFGVSINGDARCYPKRILAWHEMVRDTVGGIPINGVYCTLCGSMIVYDTRLDGRQYHLGTSGFLYRSNKLMYDRQTKSLW
ncbi:MAG: DUF3179 domain-containing (seleno)protein, partial [Planctomycetota bacterium]